jgi:hypothetical protein
MQAFFSAPKLLEIGFDTLSAATSFLKSSSDTEVSPEKSLLAKPPPANPEAAPASPEVAPERPRVPPERSARRFA